ncbi:hypothetical protein [Mesorhizobium sp. INR15]|uniref:hypothetical protein n=1 Tax=Mesorhizobium sp. INR15 TaxID=2654248 RepID=UPI0018969E21|nr:hypothetical protein [Mesorhizobium sp. INR15]QPC89146.1 hypothetical protein GA829_00245 [Mesorhizobium sp. INR15]
MNGARGNRRKAMCVPLGARLAAPSRGSRKKDTKMPPIERVQGPDIKGMRYCASLHKASAPMEVNENRQEKPIETIV